MTSRRRPLTLNQQIWKRRSAQIDQIVKSVMASRKVK